jgi:hypothetical protein
VDEELAMSATFEMVDFNCEPREVTAIVIPIAIPAAIKPYSMAVLPESFSAKKTKSSMPPFAGWNARQARLLRMAYLSGDNFATFWQVPSMLTSPVF